MWKNILKIDMDEARRLGRKYAPDDYKEFDNEKRINQRNSMIERQKKIIASAKEQMKNLVFSDDTVRGLMEQYIQMMENNIGSKEFDTPHTAFKSFARAEKYGYNI
tara:strand:- start:444 stop:761 length:318 start_codon:yes stop_codon:yes gene_type:complete